MTYSDPYSTAWERVNLDGALATDVHLIGDSASHAGATGSTSALLDYVVGVTSLRRAITSGRASPTREGLDELEWAQGAAHVVRSYRVALGLGDNAFGLTVEARGYVG